MAVVLVGPRVELKDFGKEYQMVVRLAEQSVESKVALKVDPKVASREEQ